MRTIAALWAGGWVSWPAIAWANSMDGILYLFTAPFALLTAGLQLAVVAGAAARLGTRKIRPDRTWSAVVGMGAIVVTVVLAVITGAVSWGAEYHYNHGKHKDIATICVLPHILLALVGLGVGIALLVKARRQQRAP